jgi:peroxiredoxin
VQLRDAFAEDDALRIVWVMADNQINDKTLRFIDGLGLRERVTFAIDDGSAAIDRLHLRKEDPEPIEAGVPHPTTYLLDADGVVRFVDVRRDYHIWLDPELVRETLARLRGADEDA